MFKTIIEGIGSLLKLLRDNPGIVILIMGFFATSGAGYYLYEQYPTKTVVIEKTIIEKPETHVHKTVNKTIIKKIECNKICNDKMVAIGERMIKKHIHDSHDH